MNELPHFKMTLMDIPVHFIHAKGTGQNSMPLLLHHGWPWTFWDVRKVIGPFTDPAKYGGDPADSFDVVLLSLPGYGFSSPLTQTGWNWWHTADLENKLMKEVLGYEKYAVAGGDWGALVTQQHGHKYEQDVYGIYTHFPAQMSHYLFEHPDAPPGIKYDPVLGVPDESEYGPDEDGWFERGKWFTLNESGYGEIQLTKPQTLATLVVDSPAGQLAWITEAVLLGAARARCRHGAVRAGLAQGRPRHHRCGLLPDRDGRHFVSVLLGVPGQSMEALPQPLPGRGSPNRREHLPRRDIQAAEEVDREILQLATVPSAR